MHVFLFEIISNEQDNKNLNKSCRFSLAYTLGLSVRPCIWLKQILSASWRVHLQAHSEVVCCITCWPITNNHSKLVK